MSECRSDIDTPGRIEGLLLGWYAFVSLALRETSVLCALSELFGDRKEIQ